MSDATSARYRLEPEGLEPADLTRALRDSGWELVGRRPGTYDRLENVEVDGRGRTLIVPFDRSASDFRALMTEAWRGATSSLLEDRLLDILKMRSSAAPLDSVRFRKETSAPKGLIAWKVGEGLIASARATLSAGAKAYMAPRRKYGTTFGQFANRYMDTVFMGQTSISSYVVTALTPVESMIPEYSKTLQDEQLGDYIATGRRVTQSIVKAVGSTVEAVAHYRATGSFAAFEEGVRSGISYEIVSALGQLADQADEAAVAVEWDQMRGSELPAAPDVRFELSGADAAPLESARLRLAATSEPEPDTSVRGRVHLLTKQEAGGPGTIGVTWKSPDGVRKVRVRLEPGDYHQAVEAHDLDLEISFRGTLEREGNLSWLYNARLIAVHQSQYPDGNLFGA